MKPVFLNQQLEKQFQKEGYFISIFEKLHFNTRIDEKDLNSGKLNDVFN